MDLLVYLPLLGIIFGAVAVFTIIYCALKWRVVVPTNYVHIVQRAKSRSIYGGRDKATSTGTKSTAHNVYYHWPKWMPKLGVMVTTFPISNFDLKVNGYAGYDKGRVPFELDAIAFFRIEDPEVAASRISDFSELQKQLTEILRGAFRAMLASADIEQILEERGAFGVKFTSEVDAQLAEWGVKNVKHVEMLDIRDGEGSKVIANIMAKKKSLVEMESRIAVAANIQKAETAEIEAKRTIEVNKQSAAQAVGIRTAEQEKEVGIAREQASQTVKEQQKITVEKEMAVQQVNHVRHAEIEKQVAEVKAAQDKNVRTIDAEAAKAVLMVKAEGEKSSTITVAEGVKDSMILKAEGIKADGEAKGAAETAILMAPVTAQTTLAKEIGTNDGYQKYLITVRQVEAGEKVGIEQAKTLANADTKIVVNAGSPAEGVSKVLDLFSAKGAVSVTQLLETLAGTDMGKALLDKAGIKPDTAK